MNEDNSGTRDFKPDYAVLELQNNANWKSVRTNYRRLVHMWHPDRYAQRPRERAHAQQQFISLTKAYTHLRHFHRRHGRLPFEHTGNRSIIETMDTRTPNRQTTHVNDSANTSDLHSQVPDIEPGVLGRDQSARKSLIEPRTRKRIIWTLASGAIIFATVSTFVMLDRKANQAIMERGREVVREAPASEFMPSAAEIRRSEAKGAFVQPTK